MITKALARPQTLVSEEDVARSSLGIPLKAGLNARGYSDSELPSCRASGNKKYHVCDLAAPFPDDLDVAAMQTTNMNSLPPLLRSRQRLQLPSFKSLGISSRVPDALLTPPDETIIHDLMTTPTPTSFPSAFRRSSYPLINMPKTPSPDHCDFTSGLGHIASASEAPPTTASSHLAFAVSEAQTGNAEHGTDPTRSDSEGSDAVPGHFDWLMEAADALGETHQTIATH